MKYKVRIEVEDAVLTGQFNCGNNSISILNRFQAASSTPGTSEVPPNKFHFLTDQLKGLQPKK